MVQPIATKTAKSRQQKVPLAEDNPKPFDSVQRALDGFKQSSWRIIESNALIQESLEEEKGATSKLRSKLHLKRASYYCDMSDAHREPNEHSQDLNAALNALELARKDLEEARANHRQKIIVNGAITGNTWRALKRRDCGTARCVWPKTRLPDFRYFGDTVLYGSNRSISHQECE